ncbi:MAG: CRISPR-associated protein Csx20 [Bacteroidota bacterium]
MVSLQHRVKKQTTQLFLLFSHRLTEDQRQNAEQVLGITRYISLPPDLQKRWSQVPPDETDLTEYAQPIWVWLMQHAKKGDYALVQGETGLVHLSVNFCRLLNVQPIYATTQRVIEEEPMPDGSVHIKRTFKHTGFRNYE